MKKMMQKIALAAVMLLLTAAIAGADEVDRALSDIASPAIVQSTRGLIESGLASERALAVTRAMVQNRFQEKQIVKAHQVLRNAQTKGLPSDPIINKAFEGMTKQVESGRIVSAMDAVRARYDFAFKQAAKLSSRKSQMSQTGHVIAACLTAGFSSKGIESITNELQQRSRTMKSEQLDALALETHKTARDMARLGVSPSQASALIGQALQHQFSAAQMQNMRAAFRNDSRTAAPQSLALSYSRSIEQGKSFEGPKGGQVSGSHGSGSSGAAGSGSGSSGGGGGSGGSGPGGGHGGGNSGK